MNRLLSAAWPLVLASGSPRRRELLAAAGIPFIVDVPSIIEENCLDAITRSETASLAKALSIAPHHPDRCILGADTVVILGAKLYGKPRDANDAVLMLSELNGRLHTVVSAVTLLIPRCVPDTRHAKTRVYMRRLGAKEIKHYIATGEPVDKAGSYAIQGRGSMLIERIYGDYYNVVGLPMYLVRKMLNDAGLWIG